VSADTVGHPGDDAARMRASLSKDLVDALKAHDADAAAALRSAMGALDNAQAVLASDHSRGGSSEYFAGAETGAGATEAARRVLSATDVRAVLQAEIQDRLSAADADETQGQFDAAERLRREAAVLNQCMNRLPEHAHADSDA
jgi:uncharacterized protein